MIDYFINNTNKTQMIYTIFAIFIFISVLIAIAKIKNTQFKEISIEMDAVFDEMINDFNTLLSPSGFTSEVEWYISQYKLTYGSDKLERIYCSEQHFYLTEYMYEKYKLKHEKYLNITNSVNVAATL